jgi:hypothetical protein
MFGTGVGEGQLVKRIASEERVPLVMEDLLVKALTEQHVLVVVMLQCRDVGALQRLRGRRIGLEDHEEYQHDGCGQAEYQSRGFHERRGLYLLVRPLLGVVAAPRATLSFL